jgi:hypothetical protein
MIIDDRGRLVALSKSYITPAGPCHIIRISTNLNKHFATYPTGAVRVAAISQKHHREPPNLIPGGVKNERRGVWGQFGIIPSTPAPFPAH